METGELLKALRVLANLKHDELAKKTNISRSWVYKLEQTDGPSPTLDVVKKWVKACKPKGDLNDWLTLSSKLLFDESVVEVIEEKAEKETASGLVPQWVTSILPMRFIKSIK